MPAIEVARLKLRCPGQERDRTRFAIEDSLRTSIPDERRLVLVRKMRITGAVSLQRPAGRNAAVRDGWLAAISGARHGGEESAADANCVWFASREEAEALLLSRLLAGRAVDAWYWKMAIPDWRGRPWRSWASECLFEAIGQAQHSRLLAVVQCFVAAGATERLIEALAGSEAVKLASIGMQMFRELHSASPPNLEELAPQLAESAAAPFATSMPPALRRAIVMLGSKGGEARTLAQAIVRAWVLKRSPALALSPTVLAAIVAAVFEALISGRTRRPYSVATEVIRPSKRRSAKRSNTGSSDPIGAPSTPEPTSIRQAAARPDFEDVVSERPDPEPAPPEEASAPRRRFYSNHAGLWLVVPSLIELGFRDWLAERPRLLGENPAGQLLREIARHHRVAPDDMTLAALGPPVQPDLRPEWARMWRHGLDRWLRRTVRRRLHDLVNRRGELQWSELELMIHYPAVDADLALRRRALDRDPGWIDWLGLSIRYNFGGTEDWL